MSDYNGWENWETWNVSLWIGNDETLYDLVRSCRDWREAYLRLAGFGLHQTPDGALYGDPCLDVAALDAMIDEL